MASKEPNAERRRFLRMASIGAAGLFLPGAPGVAADSPAPTDRTASRPNVLLIVSEDNGPELSCYGDPNVQTPHLDALARQGVRFQNAYVTLSVCSPSRSSIFTGLYPHQNGQLGLATHKYAMFEPFPNAPSLLKQAGYRTGIIGKLHVNPESAFPFDFRWNDPKFCSFQRRDVRKIAEVADGFIRDAGDAPFFLMVNYPDAHFPLLKQCAGVPAKPLEADDVKTMPFVGVDTPRIRRFAANYYNCLMRLDTGVGMLLSKLEQVGKAEDTLVIYLGDHGAQFSRGKCTCYEGGLRVPMICRWPGHLAPGAAPQEIVSTIDLLPTILDAVGADALDGLPGRSLLPLARGESVPWRRHLFAEHNADAAFMLFPQRSIRDGRYKLILNLLQDRRNSFAEDYKLHHNSFFNAGAEEEEIESAGEVVGAAYATWEESPPVELYDLKEDPYEFHNLADDPAHAKVRERLLKALSDWQEDTRDPLADPAKLARFAQEHDEIVRKYPGTSYRNAKEFRWHYLQYLRAPSK